MVGFTSIPQWVLQVLTSEKFFNSCLVHESEKKNEENTFCLECCICLCPHCLPPHRTHHLLQIRRYVYHDVIRLKDAERLMDCSFVQCKSSVFEAKANDQAIQRLRLHHMWAKPPTPIPLLLHSLQDSAMTQWGFSDQPTSHGLLIDIVDVEIYERRS
ncbi:unnamed protein product [Ilex paraguariensis]|uniref:B box-type domain-containing protein n=1 Tax=Ilex paraguariensis TaxID=185542 RepID=A0ABC8TNU6_9AQUA